MLKGFVSLVQAISNWEKDVGEEIAGKVGNEAVNRACCMVCSAMYSTVFYLRYIYSFDKLTKDRRRFKSLLIKRPNLRPGRGGAVVRCLIGHFHGNRELCFNSHKISIVTREPPEVCYGILETSVHVLSMLDVMGGLWR